MSQDTFMEKQEENLSIHIFSVSAALIGVCLAVIGILNVSTTFRKVESLGDDITAINASLFLAACILSYAAMKTKQRKRRYLLEKIADVVFLTGLSMLVLICSFIVFKLF